MALRNRVTVFKKGRNKQKGRGFSRRELKKANVSLKQAMQIGLPIDVRRRTAHDKNVKLIKQQLKNVETVKKRVPRPKKKTSLGKSD